MHSVQVVIALTRSTIYISLLIWKSLLYYKLQPTTTHASEVEAEPENLENPPCFSVKKIQGEFTYKKRRPVAVVAIEYQYEPGFLIAR